MKRMTFRQLLQEIHLWLALILFIPLVILGLTGSVIVYGDDIATWFGSDETRYTLESGEMKPVAAIIAAAQGAMGEGVKPAAITLPAIPGEPAVVRFARAGGQGQQGQGQQGQGQQGQGQQGQGQQGQGGGQPQNGGQNPGQGGQQGGAPQGGPGGMGNAGQVRIDPVSLAVLDVQKGMNRQGGFLGVMHQLHGSLMIPGTGRDIVGWLGVVMLFLGISGLIVWWPRPGQWRQQLTIKRKATTLRLNRDLHNTFGFWTLAVFVIVSFTGLYIVYPQPINAVVGLVSPVRDLRPNAVTVKPQQGVTPIDTVAAIALGDAAVASGLELQSAFMPQRPDQPYRLSYALPGESSQFFNTTVFIDPWAGQVVEVRDPANLNAGDTFALYQRPLHYGIGWGPVWRFLVFLSGLLPLLFTITGLTMWWIKRRRRRQAALTRQMAE